MFFGFVLCRMKYVVLVYSKNIHKFNFEHYVCKQIYLPCMGPMPKKKKIFFMQKYVYIYTNGVPRYKNVSFSFGP